MTLSFIRFADIMLAALSLSFGLGHFMELPARMAWDQYLWVGSTVQGELAGFAALIASVLVRKEEGQKGQEG